MPNQIVYPTALTNVLPYPNPPMNHPWGSWDKNTPTSDVELQQFTNLYYQNQPMIIQFWMNPIQNVPQNQMPPFNINNIQGNDLPEMLFGIYPPLPSIPPTLLPENYEPLIGLFPNYALTQILYPEFNLPQVFTITSSQLESLNAITGDFAFTTDTNILYILVSPGNPNSSTNWINLSTLGTSSLMLLPAQPLPSSDTLMGKVLLDMHNYNIQSHPYILSEINNQINNVINTVIPTDISNHNQDNSAHPYIQNTAIPNQVNSGIYNHNSSSISHPYILQLIQNDVNSIINTTIPTDISNHNSSSISHPYILQLIQNDVNSIINTTIPTDISNHNLSDTAHPYIQQLITNATNQEQTDVTNIENNIIPDAITNHNDSESAHPYIQQLITNTVGTLNNDVTSLQNQISSSSETLTTQINTDVSNINTGAGLNSDGSYTPDTNTTYIKDATSLANADQLLDSALTNLQTTVTNITNLDNTDLTNLQNLSNTLKALEGELTNLPNPNTIILRDSEGRSQIVDPVNLQDIATKNYVDSNITTVNTNIDSLTTTVNTTINSDITTIKNNITQIVQEVASTSTTINNNVSEYSITKPSQYVQASILSNYPLIQNSDTIGFSNGVSGDINYYEYTFIPESGNVTIESQALNSSGNIYLNGQKIISYPAAATETITTITNSYPTGSPMFVGQIGNFGAGQIITGNGNQLVGQNQCSGNITYDSSTNAFDGQINVDTWFITGSNNSLVISGGDSNSGSAITYENGGFSGSFTWQGGPLFTGGGSGSPWIYGTGSGWGGGFELIPSLSQTANSTIVSNENGTFTGTLTLETSTTSINSSGQSETIETNDGIITGTNNSLVASGSNLSGTIVYQNGIVSGTITNQDTNNNFTISVLNNNEITIANNSNYTGSILYNNGQFNGSISYNNQPILTGNSNQIIGSGNISGTMSFNPQTTNVSVTTDVITTGLQTPTEYGNPVGINMLSLWGNSNAPQGQVAYYQTEFNLTNSTTVDAKFIGNDSLAVYIDGNIIGNIIYSLSNIGSESMSLSAGTHVVTVTNINAIGPTGYGLYITDATTGETYVTTNSNDGWLGLVGPTVNWPPTTEDFASKSLVQMSVTTTTTVTQKNATQPINITSTVPTGINYLTANIITGETGQPNGFALTLSDSNNNVEVSTNNNWLVSTQPFVVTQANSNSTGNSGIYTFTDYVPQGYTVIGATTNSNYWKSYASGVTNRLGASICELNGNIYLFGGFDFNTNTNYNDLWMYEFETNQWMLINDGKSSNPTPGVRQQASMVTYNGQLYMGGGLNIPNNSGSWQLYSYNDFWTYNPITNEWTQLSNIPSQSVIFNHKFIVLNNNLYLIGGMEGFEYNWEAYQSIQNNFNVYQYSFTNNTWQQVGSSNALFGSAYGVIGNKIYYYAGYSPLNMAQVDWGNTGYSFFTYNQQPAGQQFYVYDTETNINTSLTDGPLMNPSSIGFGFNNQFYVYDTIANTCIAYNPATNTVSNIATPSIATYPVWWSANCMYNDEIYMFGGISQSLAWNTTINNPVEYNTLYKYNPGVTVYTAVEN